MLAYINLSDAFCHTLQIEWADVEKAVKETSFFRIVSEDGRTGTIRPTK